MAACAATDHLPREEALQMLEETCSGGWVHLGVLRVARRLPKPHSIARHCSALQCNACSNFAALPPQISVPVSHPSQTPHTLTSASPPCRAARDTIRADVYAYWVERRKVMGRPLMRRLISPTPVNDQNPYNVFR